MLKNARSEKSVKKCQIGNLGTLRYAARGHGTFSYPFNEVSEMVKSSKIGLFRVKCKNSARVTFFHLFEKNEKT